MCRNTTFLILYIHVYFLRIIYNVVVAVDVAVVVVNLFLNCRHFGVLP